MQSRTGDPNIASAGGTATSRTADAPVATPVVEAVAAPFAADVATAEASFAAPVAEAAPAAAAPSGDASDILAMIRARQA